MVHKCRKCGKKLTDPESIKRGYGPECWYQLTGHHIDETKRHSAQEDEEDILPGQLSIFDYLPESKEGINNG